MDQKTIEGTWEEITRHARELAGHRVRVTVLDAGAFPAPSNGAHADENAPLPVANPIMGMFSDAPELLDDVVEEAMKIREERPWRIPAGE
jgi:hypothetical protein